MNFPWTRHYQRYEYIINKGYVYDKVIVDIGCGDFPYGSLYISNKSVEGAAKYAFMLDPTLRLDVVNTIIDPKKVLCIKDSIFNFEHRVDVALAIEVLEHMPEPKNFLIHVSKLCTYAFLTSPCVEYTHRTRNPIHVNEYSSKDFDVLVGESFEIIEKKYQDGKLKIMDEVSTGWDSIDTDHIVQMAWCRSRYNGE